jgi:hypothetical protein
MRKRKRSGQISVEVTATEWVDVEEVIDEIDDDLLIEEVNNRGLLKENISVSNNQLSIEEKIKRLICDEKGYSYLTSDQNILKEIKDIYNL